MKKKIVTVTIQPDNFKVDLPFGETILTATKKAGIVLNIPCGGHGRCGKCIVLTKNGKITMKGDFHNKHFTSEEIQEGYRLACQTQIEGDIEIVIPPEARVTNQKILVTNLSHKIVLNPFVRRLTLEIPPPNDSSNIADADRLLIELGKKIPNEQITIPYEILHQLPTILREKNWTVTITLENGEGGRQEIIELIPGKETERVLGVAIDIGTTTIASALIDLLSGNTLEYATTFNSQMLYGEDVITRIHYASSSAKNLEKMQHCIISDINNLIKNFKAKTSDIKSIVCSGNTVMTHLLFGINPAYIWREPYTPVVTRLPKIKARQLRLALENNIQIHALPCVSSYVGGDIIADILVSELHQQEQPALLIDVGTNGEIVLGCHSWLLSCSVPAGPALEGAEVKCGMRASAGAIETISLNYESLEPKFTVIGEGKPSGICGSGLIDLLAELFRSQALSKGGKLTSGYNRIREGEYGLEYLLATSSQTLTRKEIVLTEFDIANLLKTKGAFYASYLILLKAFGLSFSDLSAFYVAGGFGNHINTKNAITIGLYPDIPLEKIKFIGNGSLGGAKLVLLSRESLIEATMLSRMITNIELSKNFDFMDEYTLASFLPHTNLDLFPSVQASIKTGGYRNES